jgi:serine/threonine protein phosphatase PrpC
MSQVSGAHVNARVQILVAAAPGKDQDAFLATDLWYAVADGATPLRPGLGLEAKEYAVRTLERLFAHRQKDPVAMFRAALGEIPASSSGLSFQPTCTVGVAYVVDDRLECACLGDTLIVVRRRSGLHEVVTDSRLNQFDDAVARDIASYLKSGRDLDSSLKAVEPHLIRNRDIGNRDDTYWVFSGDPRAASQIVRASFPLADVDGFAVCSDGFSRVLDPFWFVKNEEHLMDQLLNDGGSQLLKQLRAEEARPASMESAPRLSVLDDASVVTVRFN